MCMMRNQAGNFVAPSDDNFKAAAANAEWSKTLQSSADRSAGKDAWPITGATFIMMHVKQDKPRRPPPH